MKENKTSIFLYCNANASASAGDTIQFMNFVLFDLTQMFGIEVADYVYGLDVATHGAGAAWFGRLFPKKYYAYNTGELMSVNTSAHVTVGFNAFDPTSGTARLLGGNEYQITGDYTALSYTDINGGAETITPDEDGLFTPANDGTLTVTGGSAATTCVHLTWSGYRNDDFEPFARRSYALDADLTLKGAPCLDSANKLRYDGDEYESDGTVTRRYGTLNMGDLTWDGPDSNGVTFHAQVFNNPYNMKYQGRLISLRYSGVNMSMSAMGASALDRIISATNSQAAVVLRVKDAAYTTKEALQAAMAGAVLVYELNNPTTEEADPFQSPQVVDDFGTEEYVDAGVTASTPTRDVAIPVGHATEYPPNLRDKLQHLPSPAASDGRYVIVQSGNDMTLDEDTSPGRLTALEAKLPDPPTTNGTYWLGVQVTNDGAEYFWDIPAGV